MPGRHNLLKIELWRFVMCFGAALLLNAGESNAKLPPDVQYANISPLPGGGAALNSDGKPDGLGAMQVNIPIAYTPGNEFANAGLYGGGYLHGGGEGGINGSGFVGLGFGNWPRVYISAMAVSSIIFNDSKAVNVQVQAVKETENVPAIAFGAQDILNKEESSHNVATVGVGFYGVATKRFKMKNRDIYAVGGYGAGKFRNNMFGGVSTPISDKFTFAVEYDGYQVNSGIAWRPTGRDSHVTVLAGYNAEAGFLFGSQVTGKASAWWAVPVAAIFIRTR